MKNKVKKLLIYTVILIAISITTVYAITIIKASDVIYDNSKSGGSSSNVQGAIDELYEISDGGGGVNLNKNFISYIINLAKKDKETLAYDGTSDNNLRYIGADPDNYVEFNGELWRIIGVMNNVKDSNGISTSRIKLIRDKSIGDLSWNSNNVNDWTKSALQQILNSGDYYNRKNTYSSIGLTSEAKSMISSVMWNLGSYHTSMVTSSNIYAYERGIDVYAGRPTTWTGEIGLMYPSDYGYAVGENVRSKCLSLSMNGYSGNQCYNNDWLYSASTQWTLSPVLDSPSYTFLIRSDGLLSGDQSKSSYSVKPVVFLNQNLYRIGGNGSSTNPYKLSYTSIETDTSNASPPKIDEGGKLIPVTLADDGKVTMVSKDDDNWYNYSEKKWANAVILNAYPSKTYKVGDIIKESDIESYFVWIPKYKYKLWNTGTASKNAHEIDIIFDTKDTTDIEGKSCKTPMTSGATGNCNNGEYMTHPAFISLGVNGFWVGKFETGYRGATTVSSAQANSSDSSKIIIKPNVYSWRNNTVYNFFVSAYNYNRSLDSHMVKNIEWGAVAYLSHSKYGINREVNINNNSSYKTGSSALPSTDQQTYLGTYGDGITFNQTYNTSIGYLASTTGNIFGVYDMSGGAHEYTAAYISGTTSSSGFTTATLANYNAKYFDVYNASSEINTYQYRILGDATGEMGPVKQYLDGDNGSRWHSSWYGDQSNFVEPNNSWFTRGGQSSYGGLAGQFFFTMGNGVAFASIGSRIVLTA